MSYDGCQQVGDGCTTIHSKFRQRWACRNALSASRSEHHVHVICMSYACHPFTAASAPKTSLHAFFRREYVPRINQMNINNAPGSRRFLQVASYRQWSQTRQPDADLRISQKLFEAEFQRCGKSSSSTLRLRQILKRECQQQKYLVGVPRNFAALLLQ